MTTPLTLVLTVTSLCVGPMSAQKTSRLTLTVLLALTSLCVGLVASTESCTSPFSVSPQPFFVVWNVPTGHSCKDDDSLHDVLTKWGIVNNHGDQWFGDKIVMLYEDKFGEFPHFYKNLTVNGGIPQLADMRAHLQTVKRDIQSVIPDPHFSGLAVIDFEYWRPIFHGNWESFEVYKNHSVDLVKRRNPRLKDKKKELLEAAEAEFDDAARRVLEGTLAYVKRLRPAARWGYYYYPRCWGRCRKNETHVNNDKLSYIWNITTGIYPSIYHDRGRKIFEHLREALRVKATFANISTPVVAYALPYNGTFHGYNKTMLDEMIGTPAEVGVDGVALWGASQFMKTQSCAYARHYIDTVLGPYVRNVTDVFVRCSHHRCTGRGRCVRRDFTTRFSSPDRGEASCVESFKYTAEPGGGRGDGGGRQSREFQNYSCRCIAGWHGDRCESRVVGRVDARRGRYRDAESSAERLLGCYHFALFIFGYYFHLR